MSGGKFIAWCIAPVAAVAALSLAEGFCVSLGRAEEQKAPAADSGVNPPAKTAVKTDVKPADEAAAPAFEPTDHYVPQTLRGWTVLMNQRLLADPSLAAETLELLNHQLFAVEYRVPRPAVAKLRTVKIWVELEEPHHPCMVYHPDEGWLREHGMNPDKANCVEIANCRKFLKWSIQQPSMTLHELSHAYHDQFLDQGFANPVVKNAYDEAVKSKSYEHVLHINGHDQRHYALTNPQEYFAESSEAFFGTNDFYPFVRAELSKHDPPAFESLGKLWSQE